MVDAPLKALPLGYNVEVISLPTGLSPSNEQTGSERGVAFLKGH